MAGFGVDVDVAGSLVMEAVVAAIVVAVVVIATYLKKTVAVSRIMVFSRTRTCVQRDCIFRK